MAVEMERALLGCTTHCSGILNTWLVCRRTLGDDQLRAVGLTLIDRSVARRERALALTSERSIQRENSLQPFIRALFNV